jgi:hypothetical protein
MSPYVAWLIAEATKLVVQRIEEQGKFNSLTQDEAAAMVQTLSDSLIETLPDPEDLEKP